MKIANFKMIRLSAILLLLFAVSCNRSNYYTNDRVIQLVETHEAKFLEIVCYCPDGIDVTTSDNDHGQIKIEREFGSLRSPEGSSVTEELTGAAPTFKFEHAGDTLRLISEKWLYKHRSYVSEIVRITVPEEMQYRIRNIPGEEWETNTR